MANFKIGDTARLVNITYPPHAAWNGRIVRITGEIQYLGGWEKPNQYPIEPVGWSLPINCLAFCARDFLAPLTDPKADEFIESVKTWGPLKNEELTIAERAREFVRLRGY